jgi:chorismate dehydratase
MPTLPPEGSPRVRVGAVTYLNSRPLLFGLDRGLGRHRLQLDHDVPAVLAARLAAGELDLALLPTIELARIPGLELVPGLAIATRGPARSVRLVARRPLADVASVALDPESRTSNALVQVLFARHWRGRPAFVQGPRALDEALERCDAAVRIGDKALFEPVPPGLHVHDLGQAWTEATGLPFVFAVWAARPRVLDDEIRELLWRSLQDDPETIAQIAESYEWEGRSHPELSRAYLEDNLSFRIGPEEARAIAIFLGYAAELHLIDAACTPSA